MKIVERTFKLAAACLAAGALLAGCATQIKDAKETDQTVEAARSAFGPGFDYKIIEGKGGLADKAFVSLFQSGAASDLARDLATRLAPAEHKPVRFMVTGQNFEKTAQVILQALKFHTDNGLPQLELLYLGEQKYVPKIDEAVQRVGGRLKFAPYPAE